MKLHWFQIASFGILSLFMGMLLYVTVFAYTKKSGSTGQDIAKIQQTRYQESQIYQIAYEDKSKK